MERRIFIRYFYANDLSSDDTIIVRSNLIDDVIREWNSAGVDPFIYRHTCFICDRFENIYKDDDQFFVGEVIYVYKRPDIGKRFPSFFSDYTITRVHTDNGELSTNVKQLNGDCYMVFRDNRGDYMEGYLWNEQDRIENLQRIKDANALSNKLNTLELLANKQGQSFYGQNSIIAEMIHGVSARLPVKESKTKRVRREPPKEEEGPICVIT